MVTIPEGVRPPDISPDDLRMMTLRFLQQWKGDHDQARPNLVGVNCTGSRPPLFWIFQSEHEFLAMADSVHRDQPLYGMKSVIYSSEPQDLYQAWFLLEPEYLDPISDDLAAEVVATAAGRPFVLGGNCAGAVMALHLARRLPVRPERLVLLNLLRDVGPYDGRTELIFGREQAADFATFALGAAAFPDHRRHALQGMVKDYFAIPVLWELARLVEGSVAEIA